jgi:tetratricopeptide (TPR) repeat protein
LTNIGESLCLLGRCTEALQYFAELLALYRQKPGSEPALQAVPLRGLGLVYLAEKDPKVAYPFFDEALRILERSPIEREGITENLIATMRDLADTLTLLRRDPRRARQLRQRAAELEATLELSSSAPAAPDAAAPPTPAPRD